MDLFGLLSCEIELQQGSYVVSNNPFLISFNSGLFNLHKSLFLGFEQYSVRHHDIWAIGISNAPVLREYLWSSYLGMGYALIFVVFVAALLFFVCKQQNVIRVVAFASLTTIGIWIASIILTSFAMAVLSPPSQTLC